MWDVIVVGARCAGAPTAMLLARAGHRVLCVDRAAFGTDVVSTHFLWPHGMSYLSRWGLAEEVLAVTPSHTTVDVVNEGIVLSGSIPVPMVRRYLANLHGDDHGAVGTYASVRRRVLDQVLVDAAARAGAEMRERFTVQGLLYDDEGRVVGIRGRARDGEPVEERARIVVGADGRNSFVAGALGLPKSDERPRCTFAYWTYFSGLGLERAQLHRRGRLAAAAVPTNFGQAMTLVWGPREWAASFRRDIEGNHLRALEFVAPDLAERVAGAGRREERYVGTLDQSAFLRPTSGPGWVLAGDAECFKDQCTATGMTQAFRDAELVSTALDRWLTGEQPLDVGMKEYESRRRSQTAAAYYDYVATAAEMRPLRHDELRLFAALAADRTETDRYLAVHADVAPVSEFFEASNLFLLDDRTPASAEDHPIFDGFAATRRAYLDNPFAADEPAGDDPVGDGAAPDVDPDEVYALDKNVYDFYRPAGSDLIARTEEYHGWVQARRRTGTWPYSRVLERDPGTEAVITDDSGRRTHGINFNSQDYLSLNTHPEVRAAAMEAMARYGPHSAGSPMVLGNTTISVGLEEALGDFVGMPYVTLFPTGWATGFGTVAALVRPDDHVVIDRFAHACLQQGARAATRNVRRAEHLSVDAVRAHLAEIRASDTRNGIMVVTDGLFSVDADWPDLPRLQETCHAYDATLLVDVAHDLGAMGPGGTGVVGIQDMLGKVDLVMGAFSKSFASNGGFLATRSPAVKQYVKMFGGSHMFSNALSPVQAEVVSTATRIMRSPEGDALRGRLFAAIHALRDGLTERGLTCLGSPSPIVPLLIGNEKLARTANRFLFDRGVLTLMVEFPVTPTGSSRFRLQVQAQHSPAEAARAADVIARCVTDARDHLSSTFGHGEI